MQEASFDTSTPLSGAEILSPQLMQRRSNVYAIYETEMDNLATWNTLSAISLTMAGSFASFAIGLWVQSSMQPSPTPLGQAIVALGVPGGFVLAIIAAVIAIYVGVQRGGTVSRIKNESRALPIQTISRPPIA